MLISGASLLALEESLSILVESKCSDFTVGWVDWDLDLLSVGLSLGHVLNVNAPSSAVNLAHLALLLLAGSALDFDGVSVTNWKAAGLILFSKIFTQMSRHKLSADAGWSGEVSLARLSTLA